MKARPFRRLNRASKLFPASAAEARKSRVGRPARAADAAQVGAGVAIALECQEQRNHHDRDDHQKSGGQLVHGSVFPLRINAFGLGILAEVAMLLASDPANPL
jgi:hypothetical protein